jgi:hypothetical protein
MFLQNVIWLSLDYTALYPWRYLFLQLFLFFAHCNIQLYWSGIKMRGDGFLKCAKLFIFFNSFREIFIMGVDEICICKDMFELHNLMKYVYQKYVRPNLFVSWIAW